MNIHVCAEARSYHTENMGQRRTRIYGSKTRTYIFVCTELQELVHVTPPADNTAHHFLLVEHHVKQAEGDVRVGQALWGAWGRGAGSGLSCRVQGGSQHLLLVELHVEQAELPSVLSKPWVCIKSVMMHLLLCIC